MELMYLNESMEECGIINDFNLDLAYGRDENDYELKTSNSEMKQGYYWIIRGTEYGGVVDEVAKISNEQEVTYRGRSLQGILEKFYCYQLPFEVRGENIYIEGYPTEILLKTLGAISIPFRVLGGDEDERFLALTVPRSTTIYQFLQGIEGYKVLFGYDEGFTIRITGTVDYSTEDYFDTGVYTLDISANSYIPNHLIGVYHKEDRDIVKHLYYNADGELQPYYQLDSMHSGQTPLHDAEYERVQGQPILTGLAEKVLMIEGGSTIENYDLVTELTDNDGNTPFVDGVPHDWNTNFFDYYKAEWDAVTGEISYTNLEARPDYKPITIPSAQWWDKHWGAYYKRELIDGEYVYTQLSASDVVEDPVYIKVANAGNLPADWEKNWSKYYRLVSTDNYQLFEGRDNYGYKKQTEAGSMWRENKGQFYIYWKKYIYDITAYRKRGGKKVKVAEFQIKDSLKNGSPDGVHTFAWWKKNEGNVFKTSDGTEWHINRRKKPYWQDYITLRDYCNETGKSLDGKNGIKWGDYTVYLQYEKAKLPPIINEDVYKRQDLTSAPPMNQTYYEPDGYVVPPFYQGQIYRKIEDNYTNLVETMLDKMKEVTEKAFKVEPRIEANEIEFDIGDIVGGTHPFLDEKIQSVIAKKIVKITNAYSIDITYEV